MNHLPGAVRRRSLLAGPAVGIAAILGMVPGTSTAELVARAERQSPAFYRRRVGRFEVTALLDGRVDLPLALFVDATAEASTLLERAFLPANGPVPIPVNAFAVNDGRRVLLIDAGTGTAMGSDLGQIPARLADAGLPPASVDAVLLTHLHPDHVAGLLGPGGTAAFPNAEVIVAEAEAAFWSDSETAARAPEAMRPLIDIARDALAPYAGRVRRIIPGSEVAAGVQSVALAGHTPGHLGYLLSDGPETLLIWGDVIHASALQFARPGWGIGFDVDRAAATATRRRVLDQAAADRLLIAGMHLPFPGFGRVGRADGGFAFVQEAWRTRP
jgi:glyoxylase-like metal-dependent hydrolase (beta-lactamase superfamily II)